MKCSRIVAILLLYVSALNTLNGCVAAGQPAGKVILDHATIVADADQPSFVQYAVEDLAGYLKESTGNEIPVVAVPDRTKHVHILVGAKAVQQVVPQNLPEKLGEEGYLLKSASRGGVEYILAAGTVPRGTKAALAALMKTIQVEGKSAFVPASLDVLSKPAFAKRGIHFNGWPFGYPYAFRGWREGLALLPGYSFLPRRQSVLSLAVHRDHAGPALSRGS